MTRTAKYGLAFASLVLASAGTFAFWPSGRRYISPNQQQAVLEFYKKNLNEGMARNQVQAFVNARKAEQQNLIFVEHPVYGTISTGLGEVPGPWYCSREIVYLQFDFETSGRDSQGLPILRATDKYRDVEVIDELQDCL